VEWQVFRALHNLSTSTEHNLNLSGISIERVKLKTIAHDAHMAKKVSRTGRIRSRLMRDHFKTFWHSLRLCPHFDFLICESVSFALQRIISSLHFGEMDQTPSYGP
jgi:hypothetical protein